MFFKNALSVANKMDFLTRITIIAGLLLTGPVVQAEALPEGEWEGSVRMHEQTEQITKFKVHQGNSGSTITMFYNSRPYQFENLVIKADRITFEIDTGSDYQCELKRAGDDNFAGECTTETEEDMRTIKINMHPPEVLEPEDEPEVEPGVEPDVEAEDGEQIDKDKKDKGSPISRLRSTGTKQP